MIPQPKKFRFDEATLSLIVSNDVPGVVKRRFRVYNGKTMEMVQYLGPTEIPVEDSAHSQEDYTCVIANLDPNEAYELKPGHYHASVVVITNEGESEPKVINLTLTEEHIARFKAIIGRGPTDADTVTTSSPAPTAEQVPTEAKPAPVEQAGAKPEPQPETKPASVPEQTDAQQQPQPPTQPQPNRGMQKPTNERIGKDGKSFEWDKVQGAVTYPYSIYYTSLNGEKAQTGSEEPHPAISFELEFQDGTVQDGAEIRVRVAGRTAGGHVGPYADFHLHAAEGRLVLGPKPQPEPQPEPVPSKPRKPAVFRSASKDASSGSRATTSASTQSVASPTPPPAPVEDPRIGEILKRLEQSEKESREGGEVLENLLNSVGAERDELKKALQDQKREHDKQRRELSSTIATQQTQATQTNQTLATLTAQVEALAKAAANQPAPPAPTPNPAPPAAPAATAAPATPPPTPQPAPAAPTARATPAPTNPAATAAPVTPATTKKKLTVGQWIGVGVLSLIGALCLLALLGCLAYWLLHKYPVTPVAPAIPPPPATSAKVVERPPATDERKVVAPVTETSTPQKVVVTSDRIEAPVPKASTVNQVTAHTMIGVVNNGAIGDGNTFNIQSPHIWTPDWYPTMPPLICGSNLWPGVHTMEMDPRNVQQIICPNDTWVVVPHHHDLPWIDMMCGNAVEGFDFLAGATGQKPLSCEQFRYRLKADVTERRQKIRFEVKRKY